MNETDPMTTETTATESADSPETVNETAPTPGGVTDEASSKPDEIFHARVLGTGATGFIGR